MRVDSDNKGYELSSYGGVLDGFNNCVIISSQVEIQDIVGKVTPKTLEMTPKMLPKTSPIISPEISPKVDEIQENEESFDEI